MRQGCCLVVIIGAELDPRRVRIALLGTLTHEREDLSLAGIDVLLLRRRAHEEHQGALGLTALVGRRDHVVERRLREDLRLVVDDHVDLIEATTEPVGTGAEHDPRAVDELDRLLAGAKHDLEDERLDRLPASESLHLLEGLFGGACPVRGPDRSQARP